MKVGKCTTCGAKLEIDETKEVAICPYCNNYYSTEKAIGNYTENMTNNTAGTIINNYYSKEETKSAGDKIAIIAPPRPKISGMTAFILFLMGFWPGVIYLIVKFSQQNNWDSKYSAK